MLVLVAMVTLFTSCLKNDIPYPRIAANFLSMEAEGEIAPAVIDEANRTVTLTLAEDVDLANVQIVTYTITKNAELLADITNGVDLSKPFKVTLSIYQDYVWYIVGEQNIERYFTVEGQVGETIIDVAGKRAIVYVSKDMPLSSVKINSLKLGPAGISVMEPDYVGKLVDFSKGPVNINVSYRDKTETWDLYVEVTDISVEISDINAWTNVIWAYGSAEAGKDNGFEYRKSGVEEWTKVPAEWITENGGMFTACIRHLDAKTEYEVRAYSNDAVCAPQSVTTGGYYEIPNASFDEWWKDGKVWCPWAEGSTPFWGTGNKGATTIGDSNTIPSSDTWDGGEGFSAQLDTRFIGFGAVGKLAAGNMFSGDYVRTDGTNGVLDFGRVCKERPTRMKGYMKYKGVPMSHTSTEYAHLKGVPDTANIYVVLADWNAPFEIRTNPKNLSLIDKNADYIIAYGSMQTGDNIDKWTEFTVELDYRDTKRVPNYILIVSSASKYGDFFTGGSGSTLMIDNFWLEWDYE